MDAAATKQVIEDALYKFSIKLIQYLDEEFKKIDDRFDELDKKLNLDV